MDDNTNFIEVVSEVIADAIKNKDMTRDEVGQILLVLSLSETFNDGAYDFSKLSLSNDILDQCEKEELEEGSDAAFERGVRNGMYKAKLAMFDPSGSGHLFALGEAVGNAMKIQNDALRAAAFKQVKDLAHSILSEDQYEGFVQHSGAISTALSTMDMGTYGIDS